MKIFNFTKMKKIILFIVTICGTLSISFAQNNSTQTSNTKTQIFKSIENENALSQSKIIFYQDSRIDNLVYKYIHRIDPTMPYIGPGYRIQVFSSNNFRTAKSDATRVERQLRNAFPQHQVYVTYVSPFWKVRIGNFRTSNDAQKLRTEIIKQFPALRKECYAVNESKVKVE